MAKPIGLFIGRFQPYHTGHHLVVQGMAKVCRRVVIAIGSSDKSGTTDNPYTSQERKEMIQAALQDEDIIPMFDIVFVEIPDLEDDDAWAQSILDVSGEVDVVWTGNEHTKKCFEGKKEIKDIKEVPGINSKNIREQIKVDGDWREKVPGAIVKSVSDLGGRTRII
ncbi:MAG: adenylyltransferase/cytidyltransferase family protein [Parcubacteria group bacterium]|nr:adenylyltransferase/cytidyltransferase family protein [Parcubacteria group bacterium]